MAEEKVETIEKEEEGEANTFFITAFCDIHMYVSM